MRKKDILSLVFQLASPIALILLGAILVLAPDALTVFISKFLGWIVFAIGIGSGIAAIVSKNGTVGKILIAVAALGAGSWLMAHPLALASYVGAVLGIGLLIRGGRDLYLSRSGGRILGIATMVVGLILVLSPLTATRLVFSGCGVVMVVIGIFLLLSKLRDQRYLEDGGDPNIIDAL